MTGKELVALLESNGFVIRNVVGSHHNMVKGDRRVTVPVHGNKNLRKGTCHRILKDAGLK